MVPSSSGLGRRPLTPVTRVRTPLGLPIKLITYRFLPMPFEELTAPQTAFHFFETLFGRCLFLGLNSMTGAFSRERSSRASRTLSMPMLFKYRSVVPGLRCRKIAWITATPYPSLYRIDAVRCRIEWNPNLFIFTSSQSFRIKCWRYLKGFP